MMRLTVIACLAMAPVVLAQSIDGLWDATVETNGQTIPFRMEFSGAGTAVKGWFFNGEEKIVSTSGQFRDGKLSLNFDSYASRLSAGWKDGALEGQYGRDGRELPFHAARFKPVTAADGDVPSIAGLWEVETTSAKGEHAWRFIVRQSGAAISAAILRIDGDTGALEGAWRGGRFVLSHFDGARPNLLEVTPQSDGTLKIVQNGKDAMTAVRSTEARAKGLPEPTDPSRHTSVQDPTQPFPFRFADVNGKMVSNTDARFRGKVVIVAISGSWCPNCHDEAPFLEEMYRKYRSRGLEVVALSFEEGDQLHSLTRLRAFMKEYGIDFTVLVPGEPADLNAKLPQAVNLNSWPTTFYLGRDGRVRAVHAGFPGHASGEFHDQMRQETTHLIERLLSENATAAR